MLNKEPKHLSVSSPAHLIHKVDYQMLDQNMLIAHGNLELSISVDGRPERRRTVDYFVLPDRIEFVGRAQQIVTLFELVEDLAPGEATVVNGSGNITLDVLPAPLDQAFTASLNYSSNSSEAFSLALSSAGPIPIVENLAFCELSMIFSQERQGDFSLIGAVTAFLFDQPVLLDILLTDDPAITLRYAGADPLALPLAGLGALSLASLSLGVAVDGGSWDVASAGIVTVTDVSTPPVDLSMSPSPWPKTRSSFMWLRQPIIDHFSLIQIVLDFTRNQAEWSVSGSVNADIFDKQLAFAAGSSVATLPG